MIGIVKEKCSSFENGRQLLLKAYSSFHRNPDLVFIPKTFLIYIHVSSGLIGVSFPLSAFPWLFREFPLFTLSFICMKDWGSNRMIHWNILCFQLEWMFCSFHDPKFGPKFPFFQVQTWKMSVYTSLWWACSSATKLFLVLIKISNCH